MLQRAEWEKVCGVERGSEKELTDAATETENVKN